MNCSEDKTQEKQKMTWKTVAKKILSGLVTVVLVVTIGISLILTMNTVTGREPDVFGYRVFYVVTGSMEPTIHSGSAALVHREDSYKVGDVITFTSLDPSIYGQSNTHRIIGTDGTDSAGRPLFITKGDANPLEDGARVPMENIHGRVVWHTGELTGLGTFIGFIMTPMGFISAVVMPVMLIVFFYAKDFIRQYKEAEEKEKREKGELTDEKKELSKEEADELLKLAAAFQAAQNAGKNEKISDFPDNLTEKTQGGGTL